MRLMLGTVDTSLLVFESFFGKVTCAFIYLICWLNLDTCLKVTACKESMKFRSHCVVLCEKKKISFSGA